MGLAASQARLLMITARKDDVEYGMMRISNEKLGLTRDTTELSEKYSRSLNQRKLEFSLDGTNENTVDMNYDLLMHPNAIMAGGTSDQYLLTDSNGRVVLDPEYQSKLGLGNSGSKDDFVSAYANKDAFLAAFGLTRPVGQPNNDWNFTTNYDLEDVTTALGGATFTDADGYPKKYADVFTTESSGKFKVLECDKGDYNKNKSPIGSAVSSYVTDACNDVGTVLVDFLAGELGVNSGSAVWNKLEQARKDAQKLTEAHYQTQLAESNVIKNYTPDDIKGKNGVHYQTYNEFASIDMAQVIKTFLYYFDQACAGITSDGKDQNGAGAISTGDTGTTTNGTLGTGSENKITKQPVLNGNTTDDYEIKFYDNLYAALSTNGWVVNPNIDKNAYLENGVRNGNLFLNKFNSNGRFLNLSFSDRKSPIRDVRDKDGISQAEIEYEIEKSKLETKEEELDLMLKNLDTERTMLDTELDSVTKIINKNIERSFKMFQA